MNKPDLANLTKEQLGAELEAAYTAAKPLNDQLVDASVRVQSITAEIYKRLVKKHLGLDCEKAKCVMSIGSNVNPREGGPKLLAQLENLKKNGVEIKRVVFDQTLLEFRFYTDPS